MSLWSAHPRSSRLFARLVIGLHVPSRVGWAGVYRERGSSLSKAYYREQRLNELETYYTVSWPAVYITITAIYL